MKGFYRKLAVIAVPAILSATLSFTKVYAEEPDANAIFAQLCALCHGADGKPTDQGKEFKSPDFTDKSWQASKTDDQLIKSMTNGTDNPNYAPVGPFVKEMLGIDVDVKIFVPKVRSFGK
ncbi:MAG TPA: c-type cytochrome [Candidatus Brocadiales bacterium]|nr:c-type cytochrome [Candidatus Brocadiales bacterium]